MKHVFFPALAALLALSFTNIPARADSPEELIAQGDAHDVKFQSSEALKCYLPAERLEPGNVSLLVKISRQYRHLMTDCSTSSDESLKYGESAISYAKHAAALGPNDAEAQLSVAISYGKVLPVMGTSDRIEASRIIKDSADKALRLDPNNDLAWHVLGRWHRTLAEVSSLKRMMAQVAYGKLPTSTFEESVQCFEKAIELNPNRLMHYVELGRVYADMGKTDAARRLINKGLNMRETEKDDAATKREGRETLAKL